MAFKLTYTDGQESDYDDSTKWEVDAGVLKLGRKEGQWSVFVSPGHWATIELATESQESKDEKDDETDDDRKNEDEKADENDDNDKESN
jgi:hypothetical protein